MDADLSAQFRLASSSLPLVGLAATVPDVRIEVDEVLHSGMDHAVLLCWIEAGSFEALESALDAEASIAGWSLLEATTGRRLYRLRMADSAEIQIPIEPTFVERGTTPIDATITGGGWRMRARFPDRATLAEYRESCRDRGMRFALERLYRPTPGAGGPTLADLTTKQREALLLAHDEGYYDLPRGTNLAELGGQLGVSRRALSGRLRRAERRLVEAAVANEAAHPRG